jgi:hypothetical protein
MGASGEPVGREPNGYTGSKSRRAGIDSLQRRRTRTTHNGAPAAIGAASRDGAIGDAALLNVGYNLGDAAETLTRAQSCTHDTHPRTHNGHASCGQEHVSVWEHHKPAEPGRARPPAGGKHVDARGSSESRYAAAALDQLTGFGAAGR